MMEIVKNPGRQRWPELTRRPAADKSDIAAWVAVILDRVRTCGDEAIRKLTADIDKVELGRFEVSAAEIASAADKIDARLKAAIGVAATNIEQFHRAQTPSRITVETMPGVRCVQRPVPIRRVGLYVPGGSAPLFSTVLMLAIPARIAGCPEIVICTPPGRDGRIAPEILYTARLCGVSRIFGVGGAQAIAAMAYGTQTIPKVDKIFGPGNRYVTKAKQLVSLSQCAVDMPAGPSEVMVLADGTARADFVAADLLSQAEHGPDSQCMLVTCCEEFARRVNAAIQARISSLPRAGIARGALSGSRIVIFDDRDEMTEFANEYAAEHLIISMEDPWKVAESITAAGSIFLGNYSPESAGDYASGTNHTLPTAGWAKSFGGIGVDSFIRKVTMQEITPGGLALLAPTLEVMATAEGLAAHAQAVRVRFTE